MIEVSCDENSNFREALEKMKNNSLLFENSSIKKPYINSELKHYRTTDCNLKIYNPYLLTKYLPDIRKSARRIYLKEEEKDNYYCDPKKFCLEKIGSMDYWYLVLIINNMFSPSEFHTFSNGILVPDYSSISKMITSENNRKK